MGVKGLWSLLEPTGRATDCESLRGKRVAVDASIWLVQFIKAMRDDRGEMIPDAHVRGFFRRACRLLHHGVAPVFVFDGATPALKRRTTATRRRMREESAAKVRKAAEKVLLNALKQKALRDGIQGGEETVAAKEADALFEEFAFAGEKQPTTTTKDDDDDGEWQEDWASDEYEEEYEEEEEEALDLFVPDAESIDPEVLSALPPSVRLEVIGKMRDKRMADNREHFAAASGKMQDFSALQLQTYLKGTKIKRQIDEVMQRADVDDPMTAKRVAAQDNRDFIFAGPSWNTDRTRATDRFALPAPSGVSSLKTGLFAENQFATTRAGRARHPTALVAPQEQFLVTNLHPTLPTPSVAKSVAETPITLENEKSTLDLQITFTTENIKAAARDPLFADADADAETKDEDEDEDEDEWEDVVDDDAKDDDAKNATPTPSPAKHLALASPRPSPTDVVVSPESADAPSPGVGTPSRLRRGAVYSLSHGFLKGRSLGGWDEEDERAIDEDAIEVEGDDDVDAAIALGVRRDQEEAAPAPPRDDDAEMDDDLRAAIAMSLATAAPDPAVVVGDDEAAVEETKTEDEAAVEETKTSPREDKPARDAEAKPMERAPVIVAADDDGDDDDDDDDDWHAAAREADRLAERARMEKLLREAEEEQARLKHEIRQAKQGAEHVTDDMYREVQELLTLFGIPYIIAPQEAEAQCAYLDRANLVDAVITDDSDVFLFGASTVYRNFFADKKYCEVYSSDRIKKELGLDRDRFIQLALLLGSDYTEGVVGVGVVNALEIVSAFRGEVYEASRAFREWIDLEELTMVPDHLLPSPSSKARADATDDALAAAFKEKHRSLKKSWDVPATFPSREVIKAYQHPSVDASEETFEWGKPDLDMLRLFCIKKFAWTRDESDQILVPMMKSWSKRDAQRRIDSFFQASHAVGGRVAKFRSKRLGDAVATLTNDATEAAKMVLKRPRDTALDAVVTEGDDAERVPRLDDEDEDEDAMAALDLSQYSSDAKSPVKPKPKPKPKPKSSAPTRKKSAGKARAARKK